VCLISDKFGERIHIQNFLKKQYVN